MNTAGAVCFVGERLRQAREVRGLSAIGLAETLDLSRQAVSRYEKNLSTPSADTLARMCSVLNLQRSFFFRPAGAMDTSPIFYRSMSDATKSARCRAERRFAWLKEVVQFLRSRVSFPDVSLPSFDLPSDPREFKFSDIEELATKTRRFWSLGDGPISNVAWLLENHGVLLARHELGADSLDAFSQWAESIQMPCIVLGSDKDSGARSRFDAAHELGHLLLHRNVPERHINKKDVFRLMENQAHYFASAFLLPGPAFTTDFLVPTLEQLHLMKSKWKVSIASMLHRAGDLDLVSRDREERLWINLRQRGWKKREPLDDTLEIEQPRYVKRCFELLLEHRVIEKCSLVDVFGFSEVELESLCTLPTGLISESVNDHEPQILAFRSPA